MSDYPISSRVIHEADGSSRLIIEGPRDPEARAAWRRLHHDYLAAMRSLRYLALKSLQTAQDRPEQAAEKLASFQRHLQQLEQFEAAVVKPLLQDLPRSADDASP